MKKRNQSVALNTFAHRVHFIARNGPAAFQAFLASNEFAERWALIPGRFRRRAIQSILDAEVVASRLDRVPPPVKAPRMGDGRKMNWKDPATVARLRAAYARAGEDHELAGRILRITAGAAKMAWRRLIVAPATAPLREAA